MTTVDTTNQQGNLTENADTQLNTPQKDKFAEAIQGVRTHARAGLLAATITLASAANADDSTEVSEAAYMQNPIYDEMVEDGMLAGDRGADKDNRFNKILAQFQAFTPASQEWILKAYEAGNITDESQISPSFEGQSIEKLNGRLAANLIDMLVDIEAMMQYRLTRTIPEDGIPYAKDNMERVLENYPSSASVLDDAFQQKIYDFEAETAVEIEFHLQALKAQTEQKKVENEQAEQKLAELKIENALLDERNQQFDEFNQKMEGLLSQLGA